MGAMFRLSAEEGNAATSLEDRLARLPGGRRVRSSPAAELIAEG